MTSASAVDYLKSNLWTLTFFIIVSPIFWALRITRLPAVPTMEKETGRNDLNKEKLKTFNTRWMHTLANTMVMDAEQAGKVRLNLSENCKLQQNSKSLFFYCVALRAN